MSFAEIANDLKENTAKVILLFAFNAVGKTQLSVAYKNATKLEDGAHTGVYYNAYSEDLFVWNNDEENEGADIRLMVQQSSLSQFHSSLTEVDIHAKLKAYKPKYDFRFKLHDETTKGIKSIKFFIPDPNLDTEPPSIKISRGEERIFVWCFFLALFEVDGWANHQPAHFFIDDPVSSLDDHNIFATAFTLFELIERQFRQRKIIITTHHIGLFSILYDHLLKGEKSSTYKRHTTPLILSRKHGELSLEKQDKDVFLYHLCVLRLLIKAQDAGEVKAHHFVLLRQVLENVASFLGTGRVSHVLQVIGVAEFAEDSQTLNTLSHKNIYFYESEDLTEEAKTLFDDILGKLLNKFDFVLHAPAPEPAPDQAPTPATGPTT
jgi:hypothetical protein